jgi:NifB/MoaA-like Fe-S oxidoreductase
MLGNPNAPDILQQLQRLGSLDIQAHTQIVLCPGVNDGPQLDRSIRELAALHPTVQTISVVPVGASPKLEDWSLARDGIELVRPTSQYARRIVRQLRPLQRELRATHGRTIVQCSDEYYVTSGEPVPPAASYDGFPQYENGIGMVRTMLADWSRTKRRLLRRPGFADLSGRHAVIGCGTLIAPRLAGIAGELAELTGACVEVRPVTNTIFGERVNVSGLLCGGDYVRELSGDSPDCFILPRPSLDYFGRQFLDSMTVEEVEVALGAPVAFASQWSEVVDILASGPRRPGLNEASNGAFWSEDRAAVSAGGSWIS